MEQYLYERFTESIFSRNYNNLPRTSNYKLSECTPQASKNTKRFIAFLWQCFRQYPPDEINPENTENSVNASTQFQLGIPIQSLKSIPLFKIKGPVGRTKAAP